MNTTIERLTLAQFITSSAITMTAEWADSNPHMDDMLPGSTHWKCVLKCGRRQMTVPFSQGPAISQEPTTEDVLNCLALDAAGFENARDFDDWCSDYGYDTDSRKAERLYKVVESQSRKLERLLYDRQTYETLLFNTESL